MTPSGLFILTECLIFHLSAVLASYPVFIISSILNMIFCIKLYQAYKKEGLL